MKVHPAQLQGKNFAWGLFGAAASCVLLLFLVALMGHSARLMPINTVMHTSSSESSATSAAASFSEPPDRNESSAASLSSEGQAGSLISPPEATNNLATNGKAADSIIWVIGEPTIYIIRPDKTVAIAGPDGESPMVIGAAK